ncbi:DNA-processing protein DprA [Polaromonas aquatica]|uniref:DNA-processing protein DprA n=1 Tax=Polaromonas aquatica TaxID=332657 RepID=UPI003D65B310
MSASEMELIERFGYGPAVLATLGISSIPGVGDTTLRRLGDPENVIKLFAEEDLGKFSEGLRASGGKLVALGGFGTFKELKEHVWRVGLSMASDLARANVHCVTSSSPHYPKKLYDLGLQRPSWLFLKGNLDLISARSVAIVGTRSPTAAGDFLTKYSVSILRELDTPVVSGLAIGIDSIAHEWSLELDLPTISVLGSGMLVPYPARNIDLAQRIVDRGGLLISEYLPRQAPAAEMFVWRNRLQACISDCVVATEWKRNSGTAHTVRFAQSMERNAISLEISGGLSPSDAGRGTEHFRLPLEQVEFTAALSSARPSTALPPSTQKALF